MLIQNLNNQLPKQISNGSLVINIENENYRNSRLYSEKNDADEIVYNNSSDNESTNEQDLHVINETNMKRKKRLSTELTINISDDNLENEINSVLRTPLKKLQLVSTSTPNENKEFKYVTLNNNQKNVLIEKHMSIFNKRVLIIFSLWYLFSALTLFTNKNILSKFKQSPTLLGAVQMTITVLCGFIQTNFKKLFKLSFRNRLRTMSLSNTNGNLNENCCTRIQFWRDMLIVGGLRLVSIILCLMALKHSSISFVETIKSSAPLFTVIISRLLIGEVTGLYTKLCLIPIMIGLALSSSYEINMSLIGFVAAMLTNLTECLQSVVSKLLINGEKYKYTPLELIVFTSFASLFALIPICIYTTDITKEISTMTSYIFWLYIINSIVYYAQTYLAFTLMSYISPVTYSVTNTLKRALLIWVSILVFHNPITLLSAIGTFLTICSVFLYNHVQHEENRKMALLNSKNANN